MVCIETFKHREAASEVQRLLRDHGIETAVMVDPMEGLYPALSTYQDVVLMAREDTAAQARQVLARGFKKAG